MSTSQPAQEAAITTATTTLQQHDNHNKKQQMIVNYKLIWYAPEGDVEPTKAAVFAAGAGGIGRYEQCSSQSKCIGQFKPNEGANPTVGMLFVCFVVSDCLLRCTTYKDILLIKLHTAVFD